MGSHETPFRALRSRRWSVTCLVALILGLTPFAPGATAGGPGLDASPPKVAAAASLPEPFTGSVEDFYVVPDPLPVGERGDIIRMQAVDAGGARTGWRIMYHSVDESGRDRAVTGIVTIPNAAAPPGGWPVVANAHGTTGINASCAPSRGPALPQYFGIEGVFTQTDYIGLGPVGELHPYLQRAAESNAVIDSVRAAHAIAGSSASDEWLLVGGSQGGHAALAANEDAVTELPEYELLGTVALVPGAEVTRDFGDAVQVGIIMAFAVFGNSQEAPDMDPRDLFTPEAYAALAETMTTKCAGEGIVAAIPFALAGTLFRPGAQDLPQIREWRERNEVARRRGASPVFVAGGVKDITVVIARVRALRESLCSIGQPLTYVEAPEGDHNTTGAIVAAQAIEWLRARAAADPLDSDCPDVEPPVETTTSTGSTTATSQSTTTSTSAPSTSTTVEGTTSTTGASTTSTSAPPAVGAGTDTPVAAPTARPAPGAVAVAGEASYTG